ncbi:MAG: hypothetical protein AAF557_23960 [Pseudomonadota bacterium]
MFETFVVHCHMPKTGGSALNRRILFARYGIDRVHQMYRYIFERSSRLPIRHRTKALRSFAAAGHVPFGYVDPIYPEALYVSVFRDPVERFLSFLNFMLLTPDHAARARLPEKAFSNFEQDPDSLAMAVLADPHLRAVHCNAQVRLASGSARLGKTPVGSDHMDAALGNLSNPRYLTARLEDLDGFLIRLDDILPGEGNAIGAENIPAKLEKRGQRRLHAKMLAPATLTAIRDANDYDLRLIDAVDRNKKRSRQRAA